MSRTLEILKQVDDFFKPDGSTWTRGAFGRDENGNVASCFTPQAVKCCITGAFWKTFGGASQEMHDIYYGSIQPLITECLGGDNIIGFNDHPNTTIHDVKNLLKKAIEKAEKDEV